MQVANCPDTYPSIAHPILTHKFNNFSECQVVGDDLAEFWKVPAIPLPATHHVVVQFLVEVVQETDRLNDHGVDFVGAEFELVAG